MKANQAWSLEFDLTNLGIVTHSITFGLEVVYDCIFEVLLKYINKYTLLQNVDVIH
jgi:hypothetical protein